MDERQRIVKQTFSKKELSRMTVDQLVTLVGEAGPNASFHGSAIVRRKDGTIRYDTDAKPGNFHENGNDIGGSGLSKQGSGM